MSLFHKPRWIDDARANFVYGPIAAFFSFWQGRCTFFAIVFTVVGIIGFFKHMDLTSYALFVTAVQGLLVAHSIKEDYTSIKQQQIQSQAVTVNVTPTQASPVPPTSALPPGGCCK